MSRLRALQQYLLNYVAINIVLWVILADVVLLIFVLLSMGETKSCCSELSNCYVGRFMLAHL
jgi:hypothetical protein